MDSISSALGSRPYAALSPNQVGHFIVLSEALCARYKFAKELGCMRSSSGNVHMHCSPMIALLVPFVYTMHIGTAENIYIDDRGSFNFKAVSI